jgi:hypothetical protein
MDPLGRIFRHAESNPPTHGIAKEVGLWEVQRLQHRHDVSHASPQGISGRIMRLVAHGESPQGAILANWYRQVTGRCAKRRPVVAAVAR